MAEESALDKMSHGIAKPLNSIHRNTFHSRHVFLKLNPCHERLSNRDLETDASGTFFAHKFDKFSFSKRIAKQNRAAAATLLRLLVFVFPLPLSFASG